MTRPATSHLYLIALGSNQRHVTHGNPRAVIAAAMTALERVGHLRAISATIRTDPIGPSARCYANAAAVIATDLAPDALLHALKQIERSFGVRRGRRWSRRVLDLDIILWSSGVWPPSRASGREPRGALVIPHQAFRTRAFVLDPAASIAPHWRDPVTGRTIRQLHRRQKTGKAA